MDPWFQNNQVTEPVVGEDEMKTERGETGFFTRGMIEADIQELSENCIPELKGIEEYTLWVHPTAYVADISDLPVEIKYNKSLDKFTYFLTKSNF